MLGVDVLIGLICGAIIKRGPSAEASDLEANQVSGKLALEGVVYVFCFFFFSSSVCAFFACHWPTTEARRRRVARRCCYRYKDGRFARRVFADARAPSFVPELARLRSTKRKPQPGAVCEECGVEPVKAVRLHWPRCALMTHHAQIVRKDNEESQVCARCVKKMSRRLKATMSEMNLVRSGCF